MTKLNAIGIVASDMARSIRFYRLIGLDVPETPGEGHVDTFLPNGVRFMLDSEEVVRSFRPGWTRATGNQVALAFECDTPAEVDEIYARVLAAGFDGQGAVGRRVGSAVCAARRSRRRAGRPVRDPLDAAQSGDALEELLERFLQLLRARRVRLLQLSPQLPFA
jgi:catechol 2,3-dioxygenase-like lactoylglutathione lyase family enzyme